MQIPTKNLNNNKSTSPNFVRCSQESSNVNSLVINTNDATKWKSDKSSKIEQIGMDQTSNVEDEETNDDNIPLNKLYKRHYTTITKHWRNQKKKKKIIMKFFITSHNKDQ